MSIKAAITCYLLVIVSSALAQLDDAMVKTLLQQTPEIPAIPTKNGHYIFVPGTPISGSTSRSTLVAGPNNKSCKDQLRGVSHSGFEYSCAKNLGIYEPPVDEESVKNMKKWNINAVRIPLNEDCWLGLNFKAEYVGNNYRQAVIDYVNLLRKFDIKVVLDLHWTEGLYEGEGQGECVDERAKCQKPMPDKSRAPEFWKSVASQFKDNEGVVFDLFNEPYPNMVIKNNPDGAWKCWRDGGSACPGFSYEVAGMQDLVNAVREVGAKNLVMVGGIDWANDLSKWLEYKPNDKENNMAASWHSYDFNRCNTQSCWDSEIAPIAAQYPVVTGEIGEHGCSHTYIDKLMPWLDERNINYLAWTWNTWNCDKGPALISSYDGTPTNFGVGYRDHLAKTCIE